MRVFSKINSKLSSSAIGVKTSIFLFNLRVILLKIGRFRFSASTPIKTKNSSDIPEMFFIVGSGRSGNTLLRAILCSNENIVIPPELYSLRQIIKTALKNRHLPWNQLCELVVDVFFSTPDSDVWQIDKDELMKDLHNYDISSQTASKLVLSFHQHYAKKQEPKKNIIIGDKTPFNAYNLWWINELFPQAKFIHMYRDGRDVAMSYVKSGLYDTYLNAANRWNNSVSKVLDFEKTIASTARFDKCSYENLVLEPKSTIQAICDFLGISFDEKMISSYQNQFGLMGDTTKFKHHNNVQKKIFSSSLGKWKHASQAEQNQLLQIFPIIEENMSQLY